MRTRLAAFGLLLCTSWCVSEAHADLLTIGTATYGSSDYTLVYEDTQGLVWLDYTKGAAPWQSQMDWAAGLNADGVLTYNLDPGISVEWGSDPWRLPVVDESVVTLGVTTLGYAGPTPEGTYHYSKGYNMVNSEMGHLYYVSLANLGYYATDGTNPQAGFDVKNLAPFSNLNGSLLYASGTDYSPDTRYAWSFQFYWGGQSNWWKLSNSGAMAVRPASVDTGTIATPVPGAALLGLLGLGTAAVRLKRRRPV